MSEKEDNLMAVLSYLLAPLTSIVIYLMYKDKGNKLVLFHAMQSMIFGVIVMILMVPVCIVTFLLSLTGIGCIISVVILVVVGIIGLALMLFLMYKAYKGEKFKIPVVGDMAEKYTK